MSVTPSDIYVYMGVLYVDYMTVISERGSVIRVLSLLLYNGTAQLKLLMNLI